MRHDLEPAAQAAEPKGSDTAPDYAAVARQTAQAVREGTAEPADILPLFFRFKGKPYTLRRHRHFGMLFKKDVPRRTMLMIARRMGKSLSLCAAELMETGSIPFHTVLHVAPLFDQVQKFSVDYVAPMLRDSPVRNLWLGKSSSETILRRRFSNGSCLNFGYARDDATRLRGEGANTAAFDEIDDINHDVVGVIDHVLDADEVHARRIFAGTPKATDGTAGLLWKDSSQAHWWIPCSHCTTGGYRTWNIASSEHHLLQMLGPLRDDICEERPALLCYKCRQFIRPQDGHWRHQYADRAMSFAGHHLPQPVSLLHSGSVDKWYEVLRHQREKEPSQFKNEVLGELCDHSLKLLTEAELRAAATLPWKNNPDNPDPAIRASLHQYVNVILSSDWGGGGGSPVGNGSTSYSTTVSALLGQRSDGGIDVLWARRTPGHDILREADETVHWMNVFRPSCLVHDYGGGAAREQILHSKGVPLGMLIPVCYSGTLGSALVTEVSQSETRPRSYLMMHKTRALHTTVAAIRRRVIRTFQYDGDAPGGGILADLMRLVEHRTAHAGVYTIRSNGAGPDDFANALTIGSCYAWHISDAWPALGGDSTLIYTDAQITAADGVWYDDEPQDRYSESTW